MVLTFVLVQVKARGILGHKVYVFFDHHIIDSLLLIQKLILFERFPHLIVRHYVVQLHGVILHGRLMVGIVEFRYVLVEIIHGLAVFLVLAAVGCIGFLVRAIGRAQNRAVLHIIGHIFGIEAVPVGDVVLDVLVNLIRLLDILVLVA